MFIQRTSQLLAAAALVSTLLGCATEEDLSPVREADARSSVDQSDIATIEPKLEHCSDPQTTGEEMMALVNDFRSEPRDCGNGIRPAVSSLIWDKRLHNAAIIHSDDMANENFFSHTGSDGSTPGDRMDRQGYIWVDSIENLGPDYELAEHVVEFWRNSTAGHCDNLMNEKLVHMAVACVYTENADQEFYWTLKMGSD